MNKDEECLNFYSYLIKCINNVDARSRCSIASFVLRPHGSPEDGMCSFSYKDGEETKRFVFNFEQLFDRLCLLTESDPYFYFYVDNIEDNAKRLTAGIDQNRYNAQHGRGH